MTWVICSWKHFKGPEPFRNRVLDLTAHPPPLAPMSGQTQVSLEVETLSQVSLDVTACQTQVSLLSLLG